MPSRLEVYDRTYNNILSSLLNEIRCSLPISRHHQDFIHFLSTCLEMRLSGDSRLALVALLSCCIVLVSSDTPPVVWTYWVDDSCTNKVHIAIAEAKEMAKLASAGISNGNEPLFSRYWQILFKTPRVLLPEGLFNPLYKDQKGVKGADMIHFTPQKNVDRDVNDNKHI